MSGVDETVAAIAGENDWNQRINLIRQVPEHYGIADHAGIYGAVAEQVYAPDFAPDFAYIPWRDEYDMPRFAAAYLAAVELTERFTKVDEASLQHTIETHPETLLVFRTILGYLRDEMAAATEEVADPPAGYPSVTRSNIDAMEAGRIPRKTPGAPATCARLIDGLLTGVVFPNAAVTVRRKQDKPDTQDGWKSVRDFAANGVPYEVLLHQRHYGSPFIQLLNATGTQRGNVLEDAVEDRLVELGIPYLRTGSNDQSSILAKFNLTVRPAPDFVFFDEHETLRGLMECKLANNGGTARDKSLRFKTLYSESLRLGGVPLFAMLGGIGWKRAGDALGPVIRDTDGRVFTLSTLDEMMTVAPFPQLAGLRPVEDAAATG